MEKYPEHWREREPNSAAESMAVVTDSRTALRLPRHKVRKVFLD